jgi:xanthine dehydrogenase YagT iron-sulfur-binding subunit
MSKPTAAPPSSSVTDPSATSATHAALPNTARRRFLQTAAAAAAAGAAPRLRAEDAVMAQPPAPASDTTPQQSALAQPVKLTINGHPYLLQLEPRVTLLDALREYVGLTGTKKGCDRGQCGACTVLAGGRRINACLALAVMYDGEAITTVEGLASGETLSPLQQAFIEHDAFQCGYCTPGQLCSATALLDEFKAGAASAATSDVRSRPAELTAPEIRERMSGNICRCGAYPNIVAAIAAVHTGRRTG